MSGPPSSLLEHSRPLVRTFAPRWRTSRLTEERMARLLPGRALPDGPLLPLGAFGRAAPVVLEIGSGHGGAALGYAAAHPGHDVLAVEVHVPGVARMLAAAEERGVGNMRAHVGDAVPLLTDRVAPRSLAAVHLFFPDPWPKRKHAKRRFVQQRTLALLADRLEPGGVLRVATDVGALADHVRGELARHGGWDVVEGERPEWRPIDGFEAKGLAAGRSVTDLACRRDPAT